MVKYFTKTAIGYSHIKQNKPCQDFSASYHDDERTNISGSKSDNATLFNVNLLSKDAGGSSINNFNFTYANLHVGQFSPARGSGHSNINIDQCSFYDSTDYTFIWYSGECVIKNCYFENWGQISIGTDNDVSIMYNLL